MDSSTTDMIITGPISTHGTMADMDIPMVVMEDTDAMVATVDMDDTAMGGTEATVDMAVTAMVGTADMVVMAATDMADTEDMVAMACMVDTDSMVSLPSTVGSGTAFRFRHSMDKLLTNSRSKLTPRHSLRLMPLTKHMWRLPPRLKVPGRVPGVVSLSDRLKAMDHNRLFLLDRSGNLQIIL